MGYELTAYTFPYHSTQKQNNNDEDLRERESGDTVGGDNQRTRQPYTDHGTHEPEHEDLSSSTEQSGGDSSR